MNKVIEQHVEFTNVTPEQLFNMYTDPKLHSAILGGQQVVVTPNDGDLFSAFNGNVTGKNLLMIPGQLIVQSWRGGVWKKDDPDSVLSLLFTTTKKGARLHMAHAYTPNQFTERWDEFYWQPMKRLLSKL